jgi:hypothetical protein
MGGQAAPDAATRARSGRPAGGRRSRGCPDTGHAGRRPVRVLCPPCGRPSHRSRGRPVSTRPVSTRPVPSRCPDGRASGCPRRCSRAVRTALAPGMARCGGPSPLAQWVRRAAVVRGRPPAWGLDGKGWCCVGRGWLARGSTTDLGRRIARAQAAASPRRLATREPVQRQGAGRVGWGAPERAGAHQSPGRWVLGWFPAWPTMGWTGRW